MIRLDLGQGTGLLAGGGVIKLSIDKKKHVPVKPACMGGRPRPFSGRRSRAGWRVRRAISRGPACGEGRWHSPRSS